MAATAKQATATPATVAKRGNGKMPSWAVDLLKGGGALAVVAVVYVVMVAPMREDLRRIERAIAAHTSRTDIHDDADDKNQRIDLRSIKLIQAALDKLKIPPPIVEQRLKTLEDNQHEIRANLAEILRRLPK